MFLSLGMAHGRRGWRADPPVSSPAKPAEVGQSSSQRSTRDPADGQCTGSQQHPAPVDADTADRSRMNRVGSARGEDSPLPFYYTLLGVRRDATNEQLAMAYRRYVTLIHPDKYFGDPPRQVVAAEKLKTINAGMLVLRDPTQRARYDTALTQFPLSSRLVLPPFEQR
jgi:DnaJ domain